MTDYTPLFSAFCSWVIGGMFGAVSFGLVVGAFRGMS